MWLVGGVSIAGENWKVQQHREARGSCYPEIQPICPPGLGLSPQGLEPSLLTSTRFNSRPAMAWHRACMQRTPAAGLGQTLVWQAIWFLHATWCTPQVGRLRSPQPAHGFSRATGRMGNMGLCCFSHMPVAVASSH